MINRIREVMEYKQMSPTNFADVIGINRSSITHIFSGRNQPSLDVAKKILKAFPEVNTEWLVMGVGPMLKALPTESVAPLSEEVNKDDGMVQTDLFADFDAPSEAETLPVERTVSDIDSAEVNTEVQNPKPIRENLVPDMSVAAPVESVTTENIAPRTRTTARSRVKHPESNFPSRDTRRERISDSRGDKNLVKIVFFYEDHSFEEYRPS